MYQRSQNAKEVDHAKRNNLLEQPEIYVNPFGELIWQNSENLVCVEGIAELTIRQIEEEMIMADNDFLFFFEYPKNGEIN